jgi:predicted regulator of Ras-like GTPase activity (Roadblock/LC7/MglB family)
LPATDLESILKELNETNPSILLSIIVSPDGLVIAHEGNVQDPDRVAALYIELQLVCDKIMAQLQYGQVEEMFIRSESGCVTILPIFDKGILACMSTPEVNSGMMQLITWKAVNKLAKVL